MKVFRARWWLTVSLVLVACLLGGTQAAADDPPPPPPPTVGFAAGSSVTVTAPGPATTVNLSVKLTGTDSAATGTTTVTWTATDTTDSGNTTGTLDFPLNADGAQDIPIKVAGLKGGTITVKLTTDDLATPAPDGGDTATVTVNAAPAVSVADETVAGAPPDTQAALPVALTAPAPADVTVNFTVSPGTAAPNTDYVVATTSVTIPKGATSAPIPMTIKGMTKGGTFKVTLTGVGTANATLGNAVATVTITPSPIPQVAVQDATFQRPSQDTIVGIPVTVSPAGGATVVINYKQSDLSATYGGDYELVDTTLAVPAGQGTAAIPVRLKAGLGTQPVQFQIVVTAVSSNAKVQRGTATVTVNPPPQTPPAISISSGTITGGTADKTAAIPVTLSRATSSDVTVNYSAASGSAIKGTDFLLANGTLTIPKNTVTAGIPVTIKGGTKGGTFTVTLSSPSSNATLGTATATVTITSASAAPVVSIADATLAVGSTDTAQNVSVTLSSASSSAVTVPYTAANGTAKAGTDFVLAPGTVTIGAGQSTAAIPVTVKAGSAGGTFTITLGTPSGASVDPTAKSATVTLVNGPALSIGDVRVDENAAAGKATLTVTLVGSPSTQVSVAYATANGTATAGADYTQTSGTLVFQPGQTSKTIDVPIVNDTLTEGDETFLVTLSSPAGAALARPQATVTITDDESGFASVGTGGVGNGNQIVNGVGGSRTPRTGPTGPTGGGGGSTGTGGSTNGTAAGKDGTSVTVGGKKSGSAAAQLSVTALSRSISANRLLRLQVKCPKTAASRCSGSVSLATVKLKKQPSRQLGSAKIALKPGASATLSIRLAPVVTTLLKHAKTVRTTLTVTIAGGSSFSIATHPLTLQRPAPKPKPTVSLTVP